MARPIWTGTLSFGLLNIPVALMSGEKRTDLHFRMLDARNKPPIRYERVNAETGEEVPWKDIVKAYEYHKGNYVVLEPDDIKSAAPEESRVDRRSRRSSTRRRSRRSIFEKPYYLVPGKKAEKGYVLLRETLKNTGKIGICARRHPHARISVRGDAAGRRAGADAAALSAGTRRRRPITRCRAASRRKLPRHAKELQMAEQLIESMSGTWKPERLSSDEFRERLTRSSKNA